ncbi:hypothetical protein CEXT_223031 [Caerostris extrusa]|uniref:Uncharacterized protein n=1 Tax=Caerostris extrusa TaxID=172846 RepID=A0AAV4W3F9_CAEEX|nr:hypothetical protein CEXT_223031 [Caerostris extrusa]
MRSSPAQKGPSSSFHVDAPMSIQFHSHSDCMGLGKSNAEWIVSDHVLLRARTDGELRVRNYLRLNIFLFEIILNSNLHSYFSQQNLKVNNSIDRNCGLSVLHYVDATSLGLMHGCNPFGSLLWVIAQESRVFSRGDYSPGMGESPFKVAG